MDIDGEGLGLIEYVKVAESLAVLDIDGEGLIPVAQLQFLMCQEQPGKKI